MPLLLLLLNLVGQLINSAHFIANLLWPHRFCRPIIRLVGQSDVLPFVLLDLVGQLIDSAHFTANSLFASHYLLTFPSKVACLRPQTKVVGQSVSYIPTLNENI